MLTIKYFDMFDYPLKKEELWQWLFNFKALKHKSIKVLKQKVDRRDLESELSSLVVEGKVGQQAGYYFLAGREELIRVNQHRYQISLKKIKKAQRVGRLLALVPGVRMIAVASNLGYLNADEQADIDLFIVARRGKIWSVRFWCVVLMKLLRQRPTAKTIKNKICLSYFVDEDSLNLKPTAVGEPDVHLIYLLSQYVLIYDQGGYWQKYIQQNRWINEYLPNFQYTAEAEKWAIKFKWTWFKEMLEKTELGFENRLYKNIQLGWMAPELKQAMNRGDKKVIINDHILKLHVNDRRREINSKITNYKF